ncbi:CG8646 [Drosophila busckii]|uniref:CG8646 n=1 Tax=Drosophila busckii TaxID=30019 RepID=A0A0M3QVB6_DROBS|nr:CG8646 [Drosophila busckii]
MLQLQLLLLLSLGNFIVAADNTKRPHIIFILADDLGFNDVGFHGSAQIPTPNIDALAYSGLILNRYYVNPICTPSRSALMTGKYPIHTGNYTSHMAGKWHLGHWKREYTPLYRGFSSHVGCWSGHHDYNDHTAEEHGYWGLDMRNGTQVAYELHGEYSTHVVTRHALNVIATHNATKGPLFLYVAHMAVHSGNPYNPLPVSDDVLAKLQHIPKLKRRKYAAMLTELDASVGSIVEQLRKQQLLQNSIIIFSTDNGGPAEGFNLNFASNYPLRGVKNTLWEGGVRGAALLWSPRLQKLPRIAEQTMHIADWLPTLVEAAGGKAALANLSSAQLDGQSIWQSLVQNEPSPRKSILHNIDDIWGSAALTVGDWKLLQGTHYNGSWDGWYGPEGIRDPQLYYWDELPKCLAGKAMHQLQLLPSRANQQRLRSAATVQCAQQPANPCQPLHAPCLFNIRDDPCERNNLAARYPQVLQSLLTELKLQNSTAVPPANLPDDPRGAPSLWNYTWTNFGDYTPAAGSMINTFLSSVINCFWISP